MTPAHVLVLLKNLNFQRATGQFCDCVIRLQLNPEKLYLAHRNILAASSPVLASLLSSQGTLLDLQFPGLTHETLELLLEFIYTGSLPPPGLEDSVHSAAACLEMEELLDALDCRRANSSESPKHMEAGDPSHNYDGCNTRRKRTGGCGKETPRFGLSAQHDGLSDATGQDRQREEMSNLEDEGHDGAMANVDDHAREDSRISPKHPAMDSSEIMETTEGSSNCSSAQISSIGLVGAQQYRCAVCERDFSQRGSLNRHLRSHLGVRPYSCPRCPMTFSRQYRVLEHLRVHQRSCHGFQRTGP
ncbi:hypermethylated in cancer 2 protein-like, partial [Scleropages formosus]